MQKGYMSDKQVTEVITSWLFVVYEDEKEQECVKNTLFLTKKDGAITDRCKYIIKNV